MFKFYVYEISFRKLSKKLLGFEDILTLSDELYARYNCLVIFVNKEEYIDEVEMLLKDNGLVFIRSGLIVDKADIREVLRTHHVYARARMYKYISNEYLICYQGYYILGFLHHKQSMEHEGKLIDYIYYTYKDMQRSVERLLTILRNTYSGEIYCSILNTDYDLIGTVLDSCGYTRVIPNYKTLRAPYNCKLELACPDSTGANCSCTLDLYYNELT